MGLEFRRISSPNDHPRFIEALAGIVLRNALV
jgi:protoheme ferro-lyase